MGNVAEFELTLDSAIERYARWSSDEFESLEVAVRSDSDVDTLPLLLVLLTLDRQLERQGRTPGRLELRWSGRAKAIEMLGRFDLPALLQILALRYRDHHELHWRNAADVAPASRLQALEADPATVRQIVDLGGNRDPVVVTREFSSALRAALEASRSDSHAPFIASLVHTILFELCDNVAAHAIQRDANPPAAAYASARTIDLSKGKPRAAQRMARYQEAFAFEGVERPDLQRERYAEFCVVDRGVGIFKRQCKEFVLAAEDDRVAAVGRLEALGIRPNAFLEGVVDLECERRVVGAQFLPDAPLRIGDRPSRGLFDVAEEIKRIRGTMLLASGTARIAVDGTRGEPRVVASSRSARVPGVLVWGLLPIRPDSTRRLPAVETIRPKSIGSPWPAVHIEPLKLDKEAARLPRVSQNDERRIAQAVGGHRAADRLLAIDFQSIQARENSLDRMLSPFAALAAHGALCAVNVDAASAAMLLTSRAAETFRKAGLVMPVLDTAGRVSVLGAPRGSEAALAAWFAGDAAAMAALSLGHRGAFEKAWSGWESPFHAVIRQQQRWLDQELNNAAGKFVASGHLRLRSGLRTDRRVRWRALWSDERFLDCLSLWLSWRLSTLGNVWSIDRSVPFSDSLELCIQRRLAVVGMAAPPTEIRVSPVAYLSDLGDAYERIPVVLIDDGFDASPRKTESLITWCPAAFKIDDPDRPRWTDIVENLSSPRLRPTRPQGALLPSNRAQRGPTQRPSSLLPGAEQDTFWDVLRKGALAGPSGSDEPHASSRLGARHDFVCVQILKALKDVSFLRDVRAAMRRFAAAALKLPLTTDVLVLYDEDVVVSELARLLAAEIEQHTGHIPTVHTLSELVADPDLLDRTSTIFVDKYAFTGSKLERVVALVVERSGDPAGAFVLIDRMSTTDRTNTAVRLGAAGAVLSLPYRLAVPGALPDLDEGCPICDEKDALRAIATHTSVPQLRLHLRSRIKLLESEGFAFDLPGISLLSVRYEMCRFIDELSDGSIPLETAVEDLRASEKLLDEATTCAVMGRLLALCTPPIAGRTGATSHLYRIVETHVGWLLDRFGLPTAPPISPQHQRIVAACAVLLAHLASRVGVPTLYSRLGDWMRIFLALEPRFSPREDLPLIAHGERTWRMQLEEAFRDFLAAVARGNRDAHTAEVIHKQLRALLEPLVSTGRLLNLDDVTVRRVELIHRDNEWATMRTFLRFSTMDGGTELREGEERDIALIDLKARVDHHGGGSESPDRRDRVRANLQRKFGKLVELRRLLESRYAVDWAATQQRLAEDRLRALADLLEASGAFLAGPERPIRVSSGSRSSLESVPLRMLARAVVQEDSRRPLEIHRLSATALPASSLSLEAAWTLEVRTWNNESPPRAEGSLSKDLQAVLSMPLIVERGDEDLFVGVITVFRLLRTKGGTIVPYSFYLDDIRFLVLFHEDLPHGEWVHWLYYDPDQAKIREMLHERSLLVARASNHETLNRLQRLERSVYQVRKKIESNDPDAIPLLEQIESSIVSMGDDARRVSGFIAGSSEFPGRPVPELVAMLVRHVENVRQDFPGVDLITSPGLEATKRHVVLEPLSIVIREMIDNALKHSPDTIGNIRVELSLNGASPNDLRVSVSNPGASREQLLQPLFEPHAGPAEIAKSHWGLLLIRSICERWKARILDESIEDQVKLTVDWPLVS